MVAFGLDSLESFDSLMREGVAVEFPEGAGKGLVEPSNSYRFPCDGDRVWLAVSAFTWDGAQVSSVVLCGVRFTFSWLCTALRCDWWS